MLRGLKNCITKFEQFAECSIEPHCTYEQYLGGIESYP